jgi:hypothetical protein
MVHQYGYGDQAPTHVARPHAPPISRMHSSYSGSNVYPPVREEEEDDEKPISPTSTDATHAHASILTAAYVDPYKQPLPTPPHIGTTPTSPSARSGLSGLFSTFSSAGPDLTLGKGKNDTRGGTHRGTKDYPHLPKEDADVERDQRKGLFAEDEAYADGADLEEGDVGEHRSRPSEEVRRLPNIPGRRL